MGSSRKLFKGGIKRVTGRRLPELVYKIGTKLFRSIDYELTEYVIHDIVDNKYVLVEKETGTMTALGEYHVECDFNLSRTVVEAEIREKLNDKLMKLSKGQADEWSIQYYK